MAGLPNVSTLTLGRLDPDQVGNIIMQMTQGGSLPTEVMKEIVSKTDGNPLFVEELTKAVLESDILVRDANNYRLSGPLPPLAIPATLQDSLMARLDRLQPVKDTAQLAATIGREFSYALIREVATRDETALRYALAKLEQAELLSAAAIHRTLSTASSTPWFVIGVRKSAQKPSSASARSDCSNHRDKIS